MQILRMKLNLPGLLLVILLAQGAASAEPGCTLPQPRLGVKRADILSERQEQWLGEAQAEMVEPRYTLLPADESAYLDEIGQRLLKQLPPTSIHYTFRIFESPDLRAFSLAGGHVYISRKLIMDARNEDELAAMLAQEIGRIYIHHSASAVTRRMQKLLHVENLGDRADVYDEFERMLNVPADEDDYLSSDEQRSDDLLADRVGMYAMVKAQYDPKAFATFLDRVNNNGGYTGSLFTDIFDMTPLVSLRVRMADKLVSSLPAGCRAARPAYRPGFEPFQQAIGQQRIDPIVPATVGIDSIALQHPINPVLEKVAISPDGKFILAQDYYQIHVLSADPPKLLFSINAVGAEKAQFTPDSQSVVFHYNDLHTERWEVATGKPTDVENFVDYAGCVQTSLSPDGNVLACVSLYGDSVWLKLADIHSGEMLYQNLHFFDKGYYNGNTNYRMTPAFQALMHWSRDGRYFVAASGTAAMGYDLKNHVTVRLDGVLSNLAQQRFAFVGADRMVSTCDWNFATADINASTVCYTTFPGGKRLNRFSLPLGRLSSVAGGDRLLLAPLADAAAGVFDPATAKIGEEFRDAAVDVLGSQFAAEMPKGGIGTGILGAEVQAVALPVTPLITTKASAFSPNGRYLALSNEARGAEWDLSTAQRLAETPPFQAAALNDAGKLQSAFIPYEISSLVSPRTYPIQLGSVRVLFKPSSIAQSYDSNVTMEAFDATTEARLWSRRFAGYVPQMAQADGDTTLLVTCRECWQGKGKLIETSDLPRQFINSTGTVVEIVSNRTGKAEYEFFTPQLAIPGRPDERTAGLYGDLLAVYGNNNDTTVYRVPGGKRLFAFFGSALAGDDTLGMLAATNRTQELKIYETAHGKLLAHYLLDQGVIAARFVPSQKQLLVLTASQQVYRIDLSKLPAGE